MPYVPRDLSAGIFHIFAHCVWAAPELYRDDVDRLEFLRHLARVTKEKEWTCIAYCLMATHYHLIVEVDEGALPATMHSLNLPYAIQYNRRHGLRGHVQFRRYGSRRIVDDLDLLDTFRYVVRNPVEAGLRLSPADWPWSSYAGTVGLSEQTSFVDPAPLMRFLDGLGDEPVSVLRRHVERP
jgi:putative transposase